ncbi:MAG: YopX family protein [Bacteroides sp.]
MRDIRFRAKRISDGVWVQGQVYEHCPPILCLEEQTEKSKWYIVRTAFADWGMERGVEYFEVDPATISQFTGETDKNGNDIFENDIVKMRGYSSPFKNSVVYFKGGKFAVDGTTYRFKDLVSKTYVVLGNIFDNKDLL